jgi:uncharacterized protein YjbJ (UPF0337 family)
LPQCEFHNVSHDGGAKDRAAEGAMNWERISGNWAHWKGRVRERWGRLTDDQLLVVAGRREQLAGRIQEAYGLTRDEAERQIRNWERNLGEEDEETITRSANGRNG